MPMRQRGAVLVLFALAMVAMLGLVGLALDGGHGMLNKTRLQNTVDAAALSAAKTLDQTGDEALATAEALQTFSTNSSGLGNNEMAASYGAGDLDVDVEFSNTLHPFASGSIPPLYVRVRATNFRLPGWFIPVFGVDEMIVGASAVAGPSPTIQTGCNLAPMMVCGDPDAPPEDNFGYELGEADVLKSSTNSFEVGPGNFQLVRLGGGQGAADLRRRWPATMQDASRPAIPYRPSPATRWALSSRGSTRASVSISDRCAARRASTRPMWWSASRCRRSLTTRIRTRSITTRSRSAVTPSPTTTTTRIT